MKSIKLTTDQIRTCDGRDYNPQIWEQNINRALEQHQDVEFYMTPKGDGYDYDRYYIEYTLNDGLRLFRPFTYSASMTNGGFYRLDKIPMTADGKTYADVVNLIQSGDKNLGLAIAHDLAQTDTFDIEASRMQDHEGNMVVINNSPEARAWMTERSKAHGMIFTKGL